MDNCFSDISPVGNVFINKEIKEVRGIQGNIFRFTIIISKNCSVLSYHIRKKRISIYLVFKYVRDCFFFKETYKNTAYFVIKINWGIETYKCFSNKNLRGKDFCDTSLTSHSSLEILSVRAVCLLTAAGVVTAVRSHETDIVKACIILKILKQFQVNLRAVKRGSVEI